MAKHRTSVKKKNNSIVKLKIVVNKLQKSLSLGWRSGDSSVPEDVKEGHFAVVAVDSVEPKRFVVPLSCLTHPTFIRLLEEAAEEYGFDHEGALTIPCQPCELERILAEQWQEEVDSRLGVSWGSTSSSTKAMVQSY